jgi:hypothetical protein
MPASKRGTILATVKNWGMFHGDDGGDYPDRLLADANVVAVQSRSDSCHVIAPARPRRRDIICGIPTCARLANEMGARSPR